MRAGVVWSAVALALFAASAALETSQVDGTSRTVRRVASLSAPLAVDDNGVSTVQPEVPTFRSRGSRRREESPPDAIRTRTRSRPPDKPEERPSSRNEYFDSRRTRTQSRPENEETGATPSRVNVIRSRGRQFNRRQPISTEPPLPSAPTNEETKIEVTNTDNITKSPVENSSPATQFRRRSSTTQTTKPVINKRFRGRINTRPNARSLDLDGSGSTNNILIAKAPTTARTSADFRHSRKLKYRARFNETETNLTGEGIVNLKDVKSSQNESTTSQPDIQTNTPVVVENIVQESTEANKLKTTTLKVMKIVRRPLTRPKAIRPASVPKLPPADEISEDDNYPESFKALIQAKNASTTDSSPTGESLSLKASQKYKSYSTSLQSTQTGPAVNRSSRLRKQNTVNDADPEREDTSIETTISPEVSSKPTAIKSRGKYSARSRSFSTSSSSTTEKPSYKYSRKFKFTTTTQSSKIEIDAKLPEPTGPKKTFVRPTFYSRKLYRKNTTTSTEASLTSENKRNDQDVIRKRVNLPRTSYYSRSRNNRRNETSTTEIPKEDISVAQKKIEDTADMPIIFTLLKNSDEKSLMSESLIKEDDKKEPFIITISSTESQETIGNDISENIVTEKEPEVSVTSSVSVKQDSDRLRYHANFKNNKSSTVEDNEHSSTIVPPVRNIQSRKYGRQRTRQKEQIEDSPETTTARSRDRNIRKFSESFSKTTEATNNGITTEPEKSKNRFSSKYRASYLNKPFYKPTVPTVTPSTVEGEEIQLGPDMNAIAISQTQRTLSSADLRLSESLVKQVMNVEASHHSPSVTVSIFDALAEILTSTPKPRISTTTEVTTNQPLNTDVTQILNGVSNIVNVNSPAGIPSPDIFVSTTTASTATQTVQTTVPTTPIVINNVSAGESVTPNINTEVVTPVNTPSTPIPTPSTPVSARRPFAIKVLYSDTETPTDQTTTASETTRIQPTTDNPSTVYNTVSDLLLANNNNIVSSQLTSMLSNNIKDILQSMDEDSRSRISVDMANLLKSVIPRALDGLGTMLDNSDFTPNTTPYSLEDIKDTENIEIETDVPDILQNVDNDQNVNNAVTNTVTVTDKITVNSIDFTLGVTDPPRFLSSSQTTIIDIPITSNINSRASFETTSTTPATSSGSSEEIVNNDEPRNEVPLPFLTNFQVKDFTPSDLENTSINVENTTDNVQNILSNGENISSDIDTTSGDIEDSSSDVDNSSDNIENTSDNVKNTLDDVDSNENELKLSRFILPESTSTMPSNFHIQNPSQVSPLELWILSKKASVLKMIEDLIRQHHSEIATASTLIDNISPNDNVILSQRLTDIMNNMTSTTESTVTTTTSQQSLSLITTPSLTTSTPVPTPSSTTTQVTPDIIISGISDEGTTISVFGQQVDNSVQTTTESSDLQSRFGEDDQTSTVATTTSSTVISQTKDEDNNRATDSTTNLADVNQTTQTSTENIAETTTTAPETTTQSSPETTTQSNPETTTQQDIESTNQITIQSAADNITTDSSTTVAPVAVLTAATETPKKDYVIFGILPNNTVTKQIRTERPAEDGNAVFKFIPIDEIMVKTQNSNVLKIATKSPMVTNTEDTEVQIQTVASTESYTQAPIQTTSTVAVATTASTIFEPTTVTTETTVPPTTTSQTTTTIATTTAQVTTTTQVPSTTLAPTTIPVPTTTQVTTTTEATTNPATTTTQASTTTTPAPTTTTPAPTTTLSPTTTSASTTTFLPTTVMTETSFSLNPTTVIPLKNFDDEKRKYQENTQDLTSSFQSPGRDAKNLNIQSNANDLLTDSESSATTRIVPTTAKQDPTALLQALLAATGQNPSTLTNRVNSRVTTTTQASTTRSIEDEIRQFEEDTKLLKALLQATGQNPASLNLPTLDSILTTTRVPLTTTQAPITTRPTTTRSRPTTTRPTTTTRPFTTTQSIEDELKQYQADTKLLQALLLATGQNPGALNTPQISSVTSNVRISSNPQTTSVGSNPTTPLNVRPVYSTTQSGTPKTVPTTFVPSTTEDIRISTTFPPFEQRRQPTTTARSVEAATLTGRQAPGRFTVTTDIPSTSTFSVEEDLVFLQNLKSVLNTNNQNEDPESALANRIISLAVERSLNEIQTATTVGPVRTGKKIANNVNNLIPTTTTTTSTTLRPTTTTTQPTTTTGEPSIEDDIKQFQEDTKLLQALIKATGQDPSQFNIPTLPNLDISTTDAQETTTKRSKIALTGQTSDEALKKLIQQQQKNTGMVSEATQPPMSLSTEYGKSNDALLAALLKEQGFGPTTASSLDEQLRLAALLNQVVVTPKARRPSTPPPPPPPPRRPILDGLAWLWQQWRETGPGPNPQRPAVNRRPAPSARPSEASATRVNWFGSGPFVGNAEEQPSSNRVGFASLLLKLCNWSS